MPMIRQDGVAKRAQSGMQGDHALPREVVPASTEITAANGRPAAEGIPQLEAQHATSPGSEADESEPEPDPHVEDKAARKRIRAEANKRNRKLARQKKCQAAKAALPKRYSAGAPRTLAELDKRYEPKCQ